MLSAKISSWIVRLYAICSFYFSYLSISESSLLPELRPLIEAFPDLCEVERADRADLFAEVADRCDLAEAALELNLEPARLASPSCHL